jgi:peptidoglycan hydrolase CwlO-like protein
MSEAIIVAIITGGLSLIGVVVTCLATAKKNETALQVAQAVTDTKIEELTREVRKHNNFAEKIPVIQEQIKVINHRIDDLEDFHKPN